MRRVTLLGATGSIGQNTIDLIARAPQDYSVEAVTGAQNITQLAQDARRLRAKLAVTSVPENYAALKEALAGTGIEVAAGDAAVSEAAARPSDWTMSAIVGAAGLLPGLEVLRRGGTLALANKETLVCAGPLVMETAKANSARILPVDSEHSAIFQALVGEDITEVERVIITASGGAFRDWPLEQLQDATVAQASTHPNWAMGQRITIDSASMFNKSLELVEAYEFFDITADQIEVIIHPESMIHALVGFRDGALMAHVGPADMRHAIGYALHWPQRQHLPVERLDLAKIGQFTFRTPDLARYPALALARQVMDQGGTAGAVMNAAKEVALDAFIAGQIRFTEMTPLVAEVMAQMDGGMRRNGAPADLEEILGADHLARIRAREVADRIHSKT